MRTKKRERTIFLHLDGASFSLRGRRLSKMKRELEAHERQRERPRVSSRALLHSALATQAKQAWSIVENVT